MIKQVILPLAAALLLASCSGKGQNDASLTENEISDSTEAVLATTQVKMEPVNDELVLNGTVNCDESKLGKVFIPCSGKLSGIKVEIGDYVNRGQLLGIVHSTDAADYQKQMADANASIKVAAREYKMKQDMQKSGMVSDKDVEEAHAALLVAQAERQRLSQVAGINSFGGKGDATLTAPISGYVITKNVYNNSYIDDTNNDDPAFEIADISSVWVIGNVYENDIAKVRQGQKVYVTTVSYPGKAYGGTIDRIYSVLDNDSRTMKVRVRLDNPGGLLKPGLFATIHVILPGREQQMPAVSASAMVFENGNQYVVVRTGRKQYKVQQVEVAKTTDLMVYIQSGIEPGQQVVTRNALLIYSALTNE